MSEKMQLIRKSIDYQLCFMDFLTADKYDLKFREFCAIEISQYMTVLCSVRIQTNWTTKSRILFGDTTALQSSKNQRNCASIKKLNVLKSSHQILVLSLVFISVEDELNYHKFQSRYIPLILRNLRGFGVVENTCIDCKNMPLYQVYQIEKIIINSIPNFPENQVFILNESSKISISKTFTKEEYETYERDIKLGGVNKYINELKQFLTLPDDTICQKLALKESKKLSVILYGPPGTGKTLLIKKLTADLNLRLIHIKCARVCNYSILESEKMLQLIFKSAIDLSRIEQCVLFLDQIDIICSIQRSHSWMGKRLVAQLKLLLESSKTESRLFIIAATNQIESLDSSLRHSKYFDEEMLIGIPNCVQRNEILRLIMNCEDYSQIDFYRLAQSTPGYTGADLMSLCQRFNTYEAATNTDSCLKIINNFKCTAKRINSEFESTSSIVTWDDIGGLEEVKFQIRQTLNLQLNNPHLLAHYGLPKSKGILLYGPPGCCKTTLIKIASNDLKVNFIAITPSDIYSPYLGESEKAISEIFRKARINSPTILFIDELDAFVGSRIQSEQSTVHVRVLSTLLNEMDGIGVKMQDIASHSQTAEDGGVLVMAATNRPDLIDPALLRPGRFDSMIYLPPPDRNARKAILGGYIKSLKVKDIDLNKIADNTKLYSGADLENLCKEAGYIAMVEDGVNVDANTQRHFDKAMSEINPSLSQEQIKFYTDFH